MAVSSQRATIPTKGCTVDEVLEPSVARRLREDMDARNRRARGAVVVLAKRRSWERRVAVGLTISLTLCRIESGGSLVRNWELQANSGRSVLQLGRFSSDEGYPSAPLCSHLVLVKLVRRPSSLCPSPCSFFAVQCSARLQDRGYPLRHREDPLPS
jgi:hypothetical protein